ncbi:MAG: gfo/Idh/MocA family oxidoreductase [Pseudonocardiales bacterium]|nr:MAG: gfo/Idh/MocA family oxidoreductase [Pseudonocardiales bacterium]
MTRIALVSDLPAAATLAGYLRSCGLAVDDQVPGSDAVVVLSERPDPALIEQARAGRPSLLAGPTVHAWRDYEGIHEIVGLLPGRLSPAHEVRVRRGPTAGAVADRLGDDLVLAGDRVLTIDKVLDDTAVLLTANVGLTDQPVATLRGAIATLTLGWTAETLDDPAYCRLAHRLVRQLLGISDLAPVGVGMLGYGAIGQEHTAAIGAVTGLDLAAVCDPSPLRLDAARAVTPDVRAYADADALLADPGVGLVIVSTPPNTHAEWTLRALDAGKSVVVEKPFCLTVAEADAQIEAAAERDLTLAVYQNRRWDADFLALKRAWRAGLFGEVFHYESFVGGYGHPCNYWHSHEAISGGAIYDWGSHYLDWALDLLPQPVEWVSATTHKRVWHDVTNADHTRLLMHFADGVEAEFTHSDLAAAVKPKWYVLGTRGALVGSWRHERVVGRDVVGNLAEDLLAPADSPALLDLYAGDGAVTRLAVPPRPRNAFHRELADHLLAGAPMSVTPLGSRRNVAVMEAAVRSARDGGRPQPLPGA